MKAKIKLLNTLSTPTVLLIPGLLCDETVWQPLIAALEGHAVVADLSTQDCLTEMAKDCLAQNSGQLLLVGHSMGARVAMEVARLAPERIEKLVLLDTGIHPLAEGELATRQQAIKLADEQGMQVLAEQWVPGMVSELNHQNEVLMASLQNMVLSKHLKLHARQITALINRPDATAYLADIACPTLVMVGRDDQWSPVSQHETMQRLLPDARLEIIEGAGHFAPLERPEVVCQSIKNFLFQTR